MRRPRRPAEETREDILATAEHLFRERGISGCSIADIAHKAHMSPANVFKHFGSKAALADAICDRHVVRMINRLHLLDEQAPAPDKLRIVARKLMEAHVGDIRDNPYLFEMIFLMSEADLPSGRHYKQLIETLFAELVREGKEGGVYTCADPDAIAGHVAAAFSSVLHPVFLAHADLAELQNRCDGLATLVNAALQNPLAK